MELLIELGLAFLSIAFLLETIILVGHYLDEKILKTRLTKVFFLSCLVVVIAIVSGLIGGFLYQYFEHSAFKYSIILFIWIPIYLPIYYAIEKVFKSKAKAESPPRLDNYSTVSPENCIVIDYIIDKDRRLFSDIDALSTKISQIITLDGAIIGLVFTGMSFSKGNNLSILALTVFICSIIIGIMCLSPETYYIRSANTVLSNSTDGKAIKDILDGIIENYPRNLKKHNKKAQLFQYMLISMVLGLAVLVLSLYFSLNIQPL
jgi:MFS family permease